MGHALRLVSAATPVSGAGPARLPGLYARCQRAAGRLRAHQHRPRGLRTRLLGCAALCRRVAAAASQRPAQDTEAGERSRAPCRELYAAGGNSARYEAQIRIGAEFGGAGSVGGEDLLDLLWSQPAARPAVLVVGALQRQDIPSQPVGPRVELQPGSEWITLQEVQQRIRVTPDQWGDPRTILILAPCESAATDDQTLNDFVTAFSTAGAGAILGTQVEVGAAQATDFAQHITERLWNGAKWAWQCRRSVRNLSWAATREGFCSNRLDTWIWSFNEMPLKLLLALLLVAETHRRRTRRSSSTTATRFDCAARAPREPSASRHRHQFRHREGENGRRCSR